MIVMQRLHAEDLSGYLTKSNPEGWEVLRIPAVAQEDHVIEVGGMSYELKAGDVLHARRNSPEDFVKLEQEIGRHNFAAQYLQKPAGGTFSFLTPDDVVYSCLSTERFEYYVQSWDTAIKTTETSDYSVCTVWGVVGEVYYLVDMMRGRMAYPELKSTAHRLNSKYKPRMILIEDKASGQSLIQDLRSEGVGNIMPQKPKLDKITRFASVIPLFQASRVVVPTYAAWLQAFMDEVTAFPSGEHDDIVDSVSQFLGFMKGHRPEGVRIRSV